MGFRVSLHKNKLEIANMNSTVRNIFPENLNRHFQRARKKLNSRMNRILRKTNRECANEIEALASKPQKRRGVSFTFLFLVSRSNLTTRGVFLVFCCIYRRSEKRYVSKKVWFVLGFFRYAFSADRKEKERNINLASGSSCCFLQFQAAHSDSYHFTLLK